MDATETFAVAGLVAPHPLAAAAGRDVLIEGGTVIEAALAAAAVSAVVVPERNGLGGDALWLLREPGPRGRVRVLDARGRVGAAGRLSFYRERGHAEIPLHGPGAVLAAPGAVAGWIEIHAFSAASGGRLPLVRLLAPAVAAARDGWDLSAAEAVALAAAAPVLSAMPGFAATLLHDGKAPGVGTRRRHPDLAATLDHLAASGLDDLYRGDVARELGADLDALSCPLARADLRATDARWREPHALDLGRHALTVPPTRSGLLAAATLGVFGGLGLPKPESFDHWHGLIESLRGAERDLSAAEETAEDPAALLDDGRLARASLRLDRNRASAAEPAPPPRLRERGVWIGAVGTDGAAVSLVQSLGGGFGSGVVSGRTGILLNNRGAAFAIDPDDGPLLRPGRRAPLRALPMLLASPRDGRVVATGAAGDAAAPAAAQVAARLLLGLGPDEAMVLPRFAPGATPDGRAAAVLVEAGRGPDPASRLRSAGHQLVEEHPDDLRGAGLVARLSSGRVSAVSDDPAGFADGL